MRLFDYHNIDVIEWPLRCPNLNPIENLWNCISKRVHAKKSDKFSPII